MRATLRSPALIHLLILAIPIAAIGFEALSGAQATQRRWIATGSSICLVAAAILLVIAVSQVRAMRGLPHDRRALKRQRTNLLLAADFAADFFALALAIRTPAVGLLVNAIAAGWILTWSVPRLRQTEVVTSFVINRTPEVVFAFMSDDRNLLQWRRDYDSVEMLTAGPIRQGTQFQERARLPTGKVVMDVVEVVDYEHNHHVRSRVRGGEDRDLDEMTFEPVEGGTLVTHRLTFEHTFVSSALGAWFKQAAVNRMVISLRIDAQSRLKQILESGSGSSVS